MSKYCLKENDVTNEKLFHQRRAIIKSSLAFSLFTFSSLVFPNTKSLSFSKDLKYSTNEQTNTLKQITSYNNFYELGSGKRDPMNNADKLNTNNWKVTVDGEVENKFILDAEDFTKKFPLEERIYRLRCVEAWSMVIPWIGFELNHLIKLAKPTHKAKYISFESIYDPDNLPGQKRDILAWPYREGLRLDEARNPLTILSVGLYGRVLHLISSPHDNAKQEYPFFDLASYLGHIQIQMIYIWLYMWAWPVLLDDLIQILSM